MDNKFMSLAAFEGKRLLVLVVGAAVWFVYLMWVAPFLYEMLYRNCFQDYSYLWNGLSAKIRGTSWLGPVVLAIFYLLNILGRAFNCFTRMISDRQDTGFVQSSSATDDQKGQAAKYFYQLLVREVIIALSILVLSITTLYFCRSSYTSLKEKYFAEVIRGQSGFRSLSDEEKKKAVTQFESINADSAIDDLLHYYGFPAQSVFYLQQAAFCILVWGYPSVFVLGTVLRFSQPRREEERVK